MHVATTIGELQYFQICFSQYFKIDDKTSFPRGSHKYVLLPTCYDCVDSLTTILYRWKCVMVQLKSNRILFKCIHIDHCNNTIIISMCKKQRVCDIILSQPCTIRINGNDNTNNWTTSQWYY